VELYLLKQAIYMLRGEIKYSRSTLPEAFGILAERTSAPFSGFFGMLEKELARQEGQSLKVIWEHEIRRSLGNSTLRKEEKRKLGQLGDGLGYLDLEMQLSTLELYLEQLNEDIARASGELETKQKLYKSLGIAGGAFLVILLV
jgi:stage III sporulation protein AB